MFFINSVHILISSFPVDYKSFKMKRKVFSLLKQSFTQRKKKLTNNIVKQLLTEKTNQKTRNDFVVNFLFL